MTHQPNCHKLRGILIAAGLGVVASNLMAQPIPIANAGFESDVITDGAFVVLPPEGWVNHDPTSMLNGVQNAVGIIRPNLGGEYFPNGAPEGSNAALVFLGGGQTGEAGLQQTLAATLQANMRYRCTVQIGNIASGTSLPGSSGGPGVFFDLDGFPGYRIDILAGAGVVASDNNSLGAMIPEGEFRRTHFYFDVTNSHPQLGQPLGIRLVNLKAPGSPAVPNIEVDFDDVRLSAGTIPLPAQLSIALSNSQPAITLNGTSGATYRLESSTSLSATNWIALTNLFVPTTPQLYLDSQSFLGGTSRFYRAVIVD